MAMLPRRLGTGEKLYAEWLNQLLDYVKAITPCQGRNILLSKTPNGITINAVPGRGGGGGIRGAAGGQSYSGPFKVIAASSSAVSIVLGWDADSSICGHLQHGIGRYEVSKPSSVAISAASYVYVKITWTSTNPTFSFSSASTLPTSSNGNIYIPLAHVDYESSAIASINQIQFGDIKLPGLI